jgi:dTDP-4-dehydrorhamnose reductase
MTRILVTGASGLLGSNIVQEASKKFDVTAVVHQHPVEFHEVKVEIADLTDAWQARALLVETEPDWVIHCAADTAIDELESAPERAQLINVDMTRHLARLCTEVGSQMLYVSTDSVFSGDGGPYSETDKPEPKNVYAQSKLAGEQAARDELPDALITRTNLFGWSPGEKSSLAEWFYQNLREGIPVSGFTDVFFSPVYAPALARIFIRMLQADLHGLYHVAGADCVSKFEFGVRLARTFGFDQDLIQPATSKQINWRAKRPRNTCLDASRLAQILGIELPDLEEGLALFKEDIDKELFVRDEDYSLGGVDA